MNRKQKEKLTEALREANAPDKDKLLDRIEQRKNFAENYVVESRFNEKLKRKAKARKIALTAFVLSCVFCIVIAVILVDTALSNFRDNNNTGGNQIEEEIYEDYKYLWRFTLSHYVSFDATDMTYGQFCEEKGIEELLPSDGQWVVSDTELTQDESAYREYRKYGDRELEITVFTENTAPALDLRYEAMLSEYRYIRADGKKWYNGLLYYKNTGETYYYYVYYGENAVYCLYADYEVF